MSFFSSRVFLLFAALATANSENTVEVAPEPMPFEEKLALVEGDGDHRVLRNRQTRLTYKGRICRKKTRGVMACSAVGAVCQPEKFDYWKMNLRAGTAYTIEVDRVSCNLDPAMSLFQGVGGTLPRGCYGGDGSAELKLIASADDSEAVAAYCSVETSPWRDPKIVITPGRSGQFTLAVVNFAYNSDTCEAATPGYQYIVRINPRPSCG